jgi:hypothetical protein
MAPLKMVFRPVFLPSYPFPILGFFFPTLRSSAYPWVLNLRKRISSFGTRQSGVFFVSIDYLSFEGFFQQYKQLRKNIDFFACSMPMAGTDL